MTSRSARFLLASLFALTFSFTNAFGQGSKMKSEYDPIEEKDRDRPDLRDQWMMRGREAPKGKSAAALRLRAHRQKMALRALREAAAAKAGAAAPDAPAVTNWVPLGPAPLATWPGQSYGNVTGRITSVAMDPTDTTGNTVYAGGAFGGVWKSTNAATANPANVSWTPLTDQQAALAVGAISIKPDGSVLLVGTGEANNALANYYGLGFLRSADGGLNWNLISTASGGTLSLAGLGVSNMAWGTTTGLTNTVVAAVGFTPEGIDEGNFTSSSKRGVYASTDGGSTWTYEVPTDGTVSSNATDIVFNAKANGGAGAYFAAIRWHGVYTSTNGTTWTRMATQPGTLLTLTNCPSGSNATNTCPMYRGQFAVVPLRNEMYFWFVDPGDGDQGIWKSTNGGGSWQRILDNGITNCSKGGPPGEGACGTTQAFYNLEIAAVPDGTGTDLYAGTVNLYKCKLASGGTSCLALDAGIGADWVNLTHVYGCNPIANIAHVHPDEHGLDFRVIGGKAVMYFGNDGGVYRALDGFTGLKSGTCTAPNTSAGVGFENLNTGTMGSLTQFVSFSIHPTDQNTVLGGTQDNGSPATATATSSATWQTANFGDGGYNEINPDNPLQWFTAYTFVQIGVCNSGFGCDPITFVNNQIVTSTTLSGDEGAFYTPYILDPQNSGEMLVGTCRVWRGSTTGTGFTPLSFTFDGSVTCPGQGGQVDLVRGLAAGGPKSGGFSNVVYATTEGSGPNNGFVAGEVWATTNAAGGPGQFTNRTFNGPSGSINPNNYVISSAAVDKSNATGQTAYVGIMGFLGSGTHIWKTINAGTNWTAFGSTANGLPDSPVNALLVDSGIVYAGTDVGVFQSPTSGAAWTEVGPNAQPGATGYLPNVAVTAIRLFNDHAGTKKLRVSTYGRGIWEFALAVLPDYQVAVSNNPLTAFPSQTAVFTGTLKAVNTYSSPVTLSCGAGAPGACTFPLGDPITPTDGGAAFSVSMNSGAATTDYNFNIHTVGSDANIVTHDTPVTLHVVDFGLTAPGAVTVPEGSSGTTQFQVTASGSFAQSVTLSCSGLPANATCSFAPNPAMPTSSNPASVTLTVTAAANTQTGTTTVTIQGTTTNPAATRTTTFQLTVTAPPDFAWTGGGSHTVLAGQQTRSYDFTATPVGGNFTTAVTFGCSNLPDSTVTCAFVPAQIAAAAGATPVSLTITTKGPNPGTGTNRSQRADERSPWLPLTLPIAGIVMVGIAGRRVSRHSTVAGLCVSLALLALLVACGGSNNGPPPPPPVSVTVSPSTTVNLYANEAGNAWPVNLTQQQFTAVVNNSTNQNVTWAVTGGAGNGSIDANGLYTAPAVVPNPASVTVTATAQADASKSGTGRISILTPTVLGTFPSITVSATEGVVTHSQTVSLKVQ